MINSYIRLVRLLSAQFFIYGILLSSVFVNIALASVPINITGKLSQTTVPFVSNEGQLDAAVAFRASTFGGQVFVTRNKQLVYELPTRNQKGNYVSWVFREVLMSTTTSTLPRGLEPSAIAISQFKGRDATLWKRQLPSFNKVTLGEQYPGVTVNLSATGNNVEKLFYVAPGADPSVIQVAVEGVNGVSVNANRQLVLATMLGNIAFTAPVAYQVIDGKQQHVQVSYAINDKKPNLYGFRVGQYDPEYELVIDPLLASTFVGGVNANPAWTGNYDQDIAYSVLATTDSIYIGGVTQSTDFPVHLGYNEIADANGRPDGFIARLSTDLSTLYSATYFGTDNFDRVSALALDVDGTVVAVGQAGFGFPVTAGAYNFQGSEPVGGGFVAKFSTDLSSLIASAVVNPSHYPTEVALGNGSIYFAGRTNNPNFPITAGAFGTTCCPTIGSYGSRAFDGFAGRISTDLSSLQAMTYLGGDVVTGIAVAADSSVYITDGGNGSSGYIARFDAGLTTRMAQVAYYPGTTSGSSRHYFNDVAVGETYVVAVGSTYLNDLPVTPGVYDSGCGTDNNCNNSSSTLYIPVPDGFIATYSLDLQTLQALSYFGGSKSDAVRSVALDSAGNIYIAGETFSPDLPTNNGAHDTRCGSDGNCNPVSGYTPLPPSDVFVSKFSADISQLSYSTYLGASSADFAFDLALLSNDTVVVAGSTSSPDFPTTSTAFDSTYAGGASNNADSDAFVSVLDTRGGSSGGGDPAPPPEPSPSPTPTNVDPVADAGSDQIVGSRDRVYLDGRGSFDSDGNIVKYRWRQVSGKSRDIKEADKAVAKFRAPRVRGGKTYTLTFELQVTDDLGAESTDLITVVVR